MMGNQKSNSLLPFFEFKNAETYIEIDKTISLCEGVKSEDLQKYVIACRAKIQGQTLLSIKNLLKKHWLEEFTHLTLSEFGGVIKLAMLDIEHEIISKSTEIAQQMIKRK